MPFPKSFLYGMQFSIARQAFDGGHLASVRLHGEQSAGLDGLAIEQHGACTANARFTSDVRPGQPALIAKEMNQEQARIHFMLLGRTVDADVDARFHKCGANCVKLSCLERDQL